MIVAVIGSGTLKSGIGKHIPEGTTRIITVDADPAGRQAEKWADENGVPKLVIKRGYARYGGPAPLDANRLLAEISDIVVAVWDGKSPQIKYTIDYARGIGKEVRVYTVNAEK